MPSRGGITITPTSENPFESPKVVDEEPVQAELAEPSRRQKKDLAPTPVVMAMVVGMFQSPIVPLATWWLGDIGWQAIGFSFLLSMLFLVRAAEIWWIGNLFYLVLFGSFTTGTMFCSGCIPNQFLPLGISGVFSSVVILWLLSFQSARAYYFRKAADDPTSD